MLFTVFFFAMRLLSEPVPPPVPHDPQQHTFPVPHGIAPINKVPPVHINP